MLIINMVDYEVNFNRREELWTPNETEAGVAYAVFDSNLSIPEIGDIALQEAERPERSVKIRDLEIAFMDMKDVRRNQNPELYDFIQRKTTSKGKMGAVPARLKDLKYVLQVAAPKTTNAQMADYLGNVMIDVYSANSADCPSCMSVVYRASKDGPLVSKK